MKIKLLITCLSISFLTNAQIKKGALFIGGDISLYGSHSKGVDGNPVIRNMNNYYFSPSLGWAVKDNVIVGGRLLASYSEDKEVEPSGYESKGHRFGAAIWMRNYHSLGSSFFVFADASLGGQSIYARQINPQQPSSYYKEKGYAINAVVYPGVSYRLKKSLFIEVALNNLLTLSYERKNTDQSDLGTLKRVVQNYGFSSSIGSGVPLQVGVRWIIAKT